MSTSEIGSQSIQPAHGRNAIAFSNRESASVPPDSVGNQASDGRAIFNFGSSSVPRKSPLVDGVRHQSGHINEAVIDVTDSSGRLRTISLNQTPGTLRSGQPPLVTSAQREHQTDSSEMLNLAFSFLGND
jgi:hypothetical protein